MWRLAISPSSVSSAMSTTVNRADVPSASTQAKANQNATASLSSRKTRRSVSRDSANSVEQNCRAGTEPLRGEYTIPSGAKRASTRSTLPTSSAARYSSDQFHRDTLMEDAVLVVAVISDQHDDIRCPCRP